MIREQIENSASWSADGSGVVQFRYEIGNLKFVFNVRPNTVREVLRDIGRLAADRSSPMTWDDEAYLTRMIRQVMDMQAESQEPRNCPQCVGGNRAEIAWTILMFVCSAAIMATLAVFLLWGL